MACLQCPANSGTYPPDSCAVLGSGWEQCGEFGHCIPSSEPRTCTWGSRSLADCLCNAGYSGIIDNSSAVCTGCGSGTYKLARGTAVCTECPANSGTDTGSGAVSASACQCDAGYTGTITDSSDECLACGAGQFKPSSGDGACTDCTVGSVTNTLDRPGASSCNECDVGQYSNASGTAPCLPCPAHSGTGSSTGSVSVAACLCDVGYEHADPYCTACAAGRPVHCDLHAGVVHGHYEA